MNTMDSPANLFFSKKISVYFAIICNFAHQMQMRIEPKARRKRNNNQE